MRYPRYCLAHHYYFFQYCQRYSRWCAARAGASAILAALAYRRSRPRCRVTCAGMPIAWHAAGRVVFLALAEFSVWAGYWALGYRSVGFRHIPYIS